VPGPTEHFTTVSLCHVGAVQGLPSTVKLLLLPKVDHKSVKITNKVGKCERITWVHSMRNKVCTSDCDDPPSVSANKAVLDTVGTVRALVFYYLPIKLLLSFSPLPSSHSISSPSFFHTTNRTSTTNLPRNVTSIRELFVFSASFAIDSNNDWNVGANACWQSRYLN
jgi:hypothetical protein